MERLAARMESMESLQNGRFGLLRPIEKIPFNPVSSIKTVFERYEN